MKSPRAVAYSVLVYSMILAVALIVLSIMSLTAYGCGFDFKISSVTYMLYLMYFRAARCYSHIDWPILNGINSNRTTPQPEMPTETEAVFRTLIFTLFYLVIGILLVITCIMAFSGLRRTGKSKRLIYWLYFAPFIFIFVTLIVMDLLASGFYLVDYFKALGVNGLMRILEISNKDEMRPFFEEVSLSTRTLPPIIMFGATSNCVLLLILNIIFMFMFPRAAWQVCKDNEQIIKTLRKMELQQQPVAMPSSDEYDVNVKVTRVEDENAPPYSPQPSYNPHMRSTRKSITRF